MSAATSQGLQLRLIVFRKKISVAFALLDQRFRQTDSTDQCDKSLVRQGHIRGLLHIVHFLKGKLILNLKSHHYNFTTMFR